MRPPINSEKHIRQIPIASVAEQVVAVSALAEAQRDPAAAQHVRIGAVIKAIYIEIWLLASAQQPGSFTLTVEKFTAGSGAPSISDMTALNSYANKKNIFYTTQGLIGDANTNPVPLIRQWIKIPKGKQRIAQGDNLVLNIAANVESIDFCGLAIYKEYF